MAEKAPERKHLKRLRWSELERIALEVGVAPAVVRRAKSRDELRQAIALAQGEAG